MVPKNGETFRYTDVISLACPKSAEDAEYNSQGKRGAERTALVAKVKGQSPVRAKPREARACLSGLIFALSESVGKMFYISFTPRV
jgi:hypothetical protein